MSEMDPLEQQERARNEQSARHFIAVLCFLLAFLCLLIFLTQPLGASGLLVLLLVLLFGMSGVVLLERGKARSTGAPPSAESDTGESAGTIVEGTMVERPPSIEDSQPPVIEEGAEEQTWQVEPQEGDRDLSDEERETEGEEGLEEFKALVEQTLAALPAEFQQYIHNVAVLVESEPDEQTRRSMEIRSGQLLLGCYQGVPLTAQGHSGAALPGRIILYHKSLEAYCQGDPDCMREQVQRTVLHEVAHYFGLDHEHMPHRVR